jgi:hypothetical protein
MRLTKKKAIQLTMLHKLEGIASPSQATAYSIGILFVIVKNLTSKTPVNAIAKVLDRRLMTPMICYRLIWLGAFRDRRGVIRTRIGTRFTGI